MDVKLPASLLSSAWQEPRSWKVGVKTPGDVAWAYDHLRFATMAEAVAYGQDLPRIWTAVVAIAADPSDEAPNVPEEADPEAARRAFLPDERDCFGEEDEEAPLACGACGGPLVALGSLGRVAHFRCRNCGADSSFDDAALAAQLDAENDDPSEQPY